MSTKEKTMRETVPDDAEEVVGKVRERYGKIAKAICTIENHVLMGGFGSAVLEALEDLHIDTPVARVGWPDKFLEHASSNAILEEKYGLNSRVAVEKTRELLRDRAAAKEDKPFRLLPAQARTA